MMQNLSLPSRTVINEAYKCVFGEFQAAAKELLPWLLLCTFYDVMAIPALS